MKLTYEEIGRIAKGTVGYEATDGGLRFCRFTDRQIAFYTNGHKFADRMFNAAGMSFDFYTDSEYVELTFSYGLKSSTYPVKTDLYVDGTLVCCFDVDARAGVVDVFKADLGNAKKKHVRIYLPYLCDPIFHSFELSDGAYFEPYDDYSKNVLILGDSITHGWYSSFPSLCYSSAVARRFGWNTLNQAVSGFWFSGGWLDPELPFSPELITVAYGTNDWYMSEGREKYSAKVRAFFDDLRKIYPDTPVVTFLPIWRGEKLEKACSKEEIKEITSEIAASFGAHVIDAYPFVPHLPDFFGEGRLHPNDLGFESYTDGVTKALTGLGLN